jgi:hypothetical protein
MTRTEVKKENRLPKSKPASLAAKLDKDLFGYALTATVAGVGALALSPAVEAKVIATPANISVPLNGGAVQIDLNGDGVADVTVSATSFIDSFGGSVRPRGKAPSKGKPLLGGIFEDHLFCSALRSNGIGVNGTQFGKDLAAAMAGGARIGPALPFAGGKLAMQGIFGCGCGTTFSYGNWLGDHPPHPYLPVKFTDTTGALHYGWVRIIITGHVQATIVGYAYETIPNKPITAGVTHGAVSEAGFGASIFQGRAPQALSLGILAMGAPGLTAWRRQDEELPVV